MQRFSFAFIVPEAGRKEYYRMLCHSLEYDNLADSPSSDEESRPPSLKIWPLRQAQWPRDTPQRHSPATLPPLSVAQGCRATLSGDTSDPFRCPRVPRDTPQQHFRPFPPPKGATRHSPVTLPTLSAAQGCRATLSGDTSAPFRCPRVPRDTLRRHFRPFPPPKGAAQCVRRTIQTVY